MAGSPQLKVFNPSGEYVAACKYAEDAAAIVAAYGDGAQIRLGHAKSATLFTEGQEECSAGNSYDAVAQLVNDRWDKVLAEIKAKFIKQVSELKY